MAKSTSEKVTRIGVFNALNDRGYLGYDSTLKELQELKRQPMKTRSLKPI